MANVSQEEQKQIIHNTKAYNSMILSPAFKDRMGSALGKIMNPERMISLSLSAINKTPRLALCSKETVYGALLNCAQLGLEPMSSLGHIYFIPFRNNSQNRYDCTVIIGYKGYIELAFRSGRVQEFYCDVVYNCDEFVVKHGLNRDIIHIKNYDDHKERVDKNIKGFYAIIKYKDGGFDFQYMTKHEVDTVRASSRGKDSDPWRLHYSEMGQKTAIRKLMKRVPLTPHQAQAVELDEQSERGEVDALSEAVNDLPNDFRDDSAKSDNPLDNVSPDAGGKTPAV